MTLMHRFLIPSAIFWGVRHSHGSSGGKSLASGVLCLNTASNHHKHAEQDIPRHSHRVQVRRERKAVHSFHFLVAKECYSVSCRMHTGIILLKNKRRTKATMAGRKQIFWQCIDAIVSSSCVFDKGQFRSTTSPNSSPNHDGFSTILSTEYGLLFVSQTVPVLLKPVWAVQIPFLFIWEDCSFPVALTKIYHSHGPVKTLLLMCRGRFGGLIALLVRELARAVQHPSSSCAMDVLLQIFGELSSAEGSRSCSSEQTTLRWGHYFGRTSFFEALSVLVGVLEIIGHRRFVATESAGDFLLAVVICCPGLDLTLLLVSEPLSIPHALYTRYRRSRNARTVFWKCQNNVPAAKEGKNENGCNLSQNIFFLFSYFFLHFFSIELLHRVCSDDAISHAIFGLI